MLTLWVVRVFWACRVRGARTRASLAPPPRGRASSATTGTGGTVSLEADGQAEQCSAYQFGGGVVSGVVICGRVLLVLHALLWGGVDVCLLPNMARGR